jgi:hypothetical protein
VPKARSKKEQSTGKASWQDLPICSETFASVISGTWVTHPTKGTGMVVHCGYTRCLKNGAPSKCRSTITVSLNGPVEKNELITAYAFRKQGWRVLEEKLDI